MYQQNTFKHNKTMLLVFSGVVILFIQTLYASNHDCQEDRNSVLTPSKHGSTGKWLDEEVPKRGWTPLEVADLGKVKKICEMCERERLRYIHEMTHPDHSNLVVGCICAGHMEGNEVEAQNRDRKLKNRAQRRQNWMKRNWRISGIGIHYLVLKEDGKDSVLRLRKRRGQYSISVNHRNWTRWFDSADAVKAAFFDKMFPPRRRFAN